jgi:hypothetical protein
MRLLPLLFFMPSCAISYQLGRKLYKSREAGFIVMLAYAGLGYIVFFSVYLRPYALIIPMMPLGLIFVIRYFEKPSIKRAFVLGIHMALMFYISIMSIFPFLVFGLFSLFYYSRQVWRWWIVGLIAAIAAIPEILAKLQTISSRTSVSFESNLPPLPEALWTIFVDYFGLAFIVWFGLLALSLLLIFRVERRNRWLFLFFFIWAFLGTCLLYWLHPRTSLFGIRYAWWIAWAFPLWLAAGLMHLPKWGKRLSLLLLLALSFVITPEQMAEYKEPIPDVENLFEWFSQHYEAGDVLVIDPNTRMASAGLRADVWDYYTMAFFPNGLNLVDSPLPSDNRVWYLHSNPRNEPELEASVHTNRMESIFYGSSGFQVQLFEGAPELEGVLFENGLRFHGYEVLDGEGLANFPLVVHEGAEIRLRLWWSVDAPLPQDYSVGLKVMGDLWEGVLAQQDSAPQAIYLLPYFNETLEPFGSMITWQTGQYYVEERVITLPYEPRLRRSQYTMYLTVYQWQDGQRIAADGLNEDMLLPLFDFTIMAW